MRFFLIVCFSLSLLSLQVTGLQAQGPEPVPPELMGKIDPGLIKELAAEPGGEGDPGLANIIIVMRERPDLTAARSTADPIARRAAMVSSMQATAQRSQAGVRAVLAAAEARREASDIRPFWIVNRVAAKATWQTVLALARRDDVAFVRQEVIVSLPPLTGEEISRAEGELEWGVTRVKAPQVWQAFGLDGAGVVVANVDSGVDYFHPALRSRFRGYLSDTLPPQQAGNWFDSIGDEALYPVDSNGHGTHTMGTIVGGGGVGVAPGAQWIAVRAFDSFGSALESWLHDAYQWILAPNGDPALAPDIVNNSWSNNIGSNLAFEEDLQRLLEAGIIPVFAAGNSGPQPRTVGAPASYDNAFSVGATDIDDDIAVFSSRGLSPWEKLKPEVSAPGVDVVSTWPGGSYKSLNGTSMATPHVAGVWALMLQADPTLTYQEQAQILMDTATPVGVISPNNTFGWGIVDAYAALIRVTNAGTLRGTVRAQGNNQPIPEARLSLTRRSDNQLSTTTADQTGVYSWAGLAGDYDVTASAFGFSSQTQPGVRIVTGSVTTQDLTLTPLPTGGLSGLITESGTGTPLSATITLVDTPITLTSHPDSGAYTTSLPVGVYTLTVGAPGHRVAEVTNVDIQVGRTTQLNVALETAPTILLVDSGPWYNQSKLSYYQQALDDNRFYYDTHIVKKIPDNVPISSTLTPYDVVIWSAPNDAPGLIGAGPALEDFLVQGGYLFLSGQDVGFFDGGGTFTVAPYYVNDLKSGLVIDNAGEDQVVPVPGKPFAGLTFTISGGDGADNQVTPDVLTVLDPDHTASVFTYPVDADIALLLQEGQQADAGHQAGHCLPFRAINLGFGLEGVSSRSTRAQILAQSVNWFQSPPVVDRFAATPPIETNVDDFGKTVTHTLRLFNQAEAGPSDTYTFNLSGNQWTVDFPYPSITLKPCETAVLIFTVTIPPDVPRNAQDQLTITVASTQVPGLQATVTRTTKASAALLLVDDDRWFEYEAKYQQALTSAGIPFDTWDTGEGNPEGAPPLAVLQQYPMVFWFNGYDWFDPLSPEEEDVIQAYLEGGGNFALSSQEYLYRLPEHQASPFAQAYLGVFTHSEILSSTMAFGVPSSPLGDGLGPYPLTFPLSYRNWTDSITPTQAARPAFLSQDGLVNAVTNQSVAPATWHTAFFAFGLELLADDDLRELMNHTVGWLSWLGNSSARADVEQATDGNLIRYTARLTNDGAQPIQRAIFTATFPYPLSLVSGSATGGATEQNGEVIWGAPLAQNQSVTLTYQAQVAANVPYGTLSKQISRLHIEDLGLAFDKVVPIPINTPDWRTASLRSSLETVGLGEILTYTLTLTNTGMADAPQVTVTTQIPPYLDILTDTIGLNLSQAGSWELSRGTITWRTPVAREQPLEFTYAARLAAIPYPFQLDTIFYADDDYRDDYRWKTRVNVEPYRYYYPLMFR